MSVMSSNGEVGCEVQELVRLPLLLKSGRRFAFCVLVSFVAGLIQVDIKGICEWIVKPPHPILLFFGTLIAFVVGVGLVYFALHTKYLLRVQSSRAIILFYGSSVPATLAGIWCRFIFVRPERCPRVVLGAPIDWRAVAVAFMVTSVASAIATAVTTVLGASNYSEVRSSLQKFIRGMASDGAAFSAQAAAAQATFIFDPRRLSELTTLLKSTSEGMQKIAAGEPAAYCKFVERVIQDVEKLRAYAATSAVLESPHRFLQACGLAPAGSVSPQVREAHSRAYECLARISNA
jgi:hypothetical protein